MRRTYRSKRDTGGALDHRDMLLNMDEKSSAFDAFYIENLKQTKRELSCVATSNHVGTASNKVRKRKYVKRLVKQVEPVRLRETLSTSAYLTPDKSIRVNRILDPFDMLLNSSPLPQAPPQDEISETNVPKKESKTYVRKRKPKVKKINYSYSDSTESDKENTINSNVTDIRTHELLIEKVPEKSRKCYDESINKIVGNLSLINNLKRKCINVSFNTSYKTRNRLTKNYQSPIMQKSPLCSTPFKEKYRGVSIFTFSPIMQKEPNEMSSISDEKDESSNSIILVSKSLALKSYNEYKLSPLAHISDKGINNISVNSVKDNSDVIVSEDKVQNEMELIENQKQSDNSISNNEESSCQITKAEPFLGFSNNGTGDITKEKMETMLSCLENQSIQDVDFDEDKLGTKKCDADDSTSSISTDENELVTNKSDSDDSLSNVTDDSASENSSSNIIISKEKSESNKNNSSNLSTNIDVDENTRKSNITSSDESKSTTNTSVHFDKYNTSTDTSESIVPSQSSDSESLYDTCDSDQSSITDNYLAKKELLVAIERMNDSIFLKYYEKMLKTQDERMSNQTDNEDFESLANNSNNEINNQSKSENVYSDELKANAIVITDSSTTEDVISSEEFYEEESKEETERYVSFVTTRRKNEIVNDSMFQFNQSYGSSSTDCDKTVVSNKININKFHNIHMENTIKDNLNEKNIDAIEYYKDIKTDSVQDEIASRKYFRRSSLSNKSNAISPQLNDNFKSENSDNDLVSIINTRGSRNSRQSKDTTIVSPISKSQFSKSSSKKRVSRTTTRKTTRLSKQSNSTSSELNNRKSENNLTNSTGVNDTLENNSNITENRDSTSPLSAENISCMLKECVVSHPERASYTGAEVKTTIVLQPGKKWERSLSIYRRMSMVADHFDQSILEDDCTQNKGRKYRQSVINTMEMQEYRDSLHNDSINSRRSTFVCNPGRPTIRFVKDPNFSRVSLNTSSVFDDLKGFLSEECDDTVIELSKLSIADSEREVTILDNFHVTERVTTARDYVLRRCNQTDPILFDECYPETVLKNCHKIGEGVYGEVFLWRGRDGRARVMKIVPIAGSVKVNGEHQKDFHEIISEIVIAMELSALRAPIADIERQLDEGNDIHALELHAIENATDIFNEVLAVRCVYGPYPSRLLDLWELYDECKGSENDNPAALPTDQRYIVLELANAGQDLESYQFASAQQAHALFQQIAFGLAVGEEAFQFEHRDLHWGNVLIAPTEQKFATFVLRGRTYRVPRRGVAATVIDYSLSRLTLPLAADCAALYNDLAADDQLFDAVGDYQFELYRLMRDKLGNDWKNFEPYTNILWLHYTVDKMITALRYKRTNTKIHRHYIEKLKGIKNSILEYGSAVQYVLTDIDF